MFGIIESFIVEGFFRFINFVSNTFSKRRAENNPSKDDYKKVYHKLSPGAKKILATICIWTNKGKYLNDMSWFPYLQLLKDKSGEKHEKQIKKWVDELVMADLLTEYTNEKNPALTDNGQMVCKLSKRE